MTVHPLRIPVTPDMISPPISLSSPTALTNFALITPAIHSALEYLSHKLSQKNLHLTLIVSRTSPLPIGQGCKLSAYPVQVSKSPVVVVGDDEDSMQRLFNTLAQRAARKFLLQLDWITYATPTAHARRNLNWAYIVRRSLVQNDVLFSAEGLTVLNIDRVYTLKQTLSVLSKGKNACKRIPESVYLDSSIWLLRQIMRETRGRPLSRAFFHCTYDHVCVSEAVLVEVAKGYFARYKQAAIVFPARTRNGNAEGGKNAYYVVQKQRQKRMGKMFEGRSPASNGAGSQHGLKEGLSKSRSRKSPTRPGPKTPLSASDITPVTKSEWNELIQMSVTMRMPTEMPASNCMSGAREIRIIPVNVVGREDRGTLELQAWV